MIPAHQAAARIKQALRPIDDGGQSHGGPDGWSPTAEEISEWEDSFHEAASPEALRALLAERDELAKDAVRWRTALERVVECDWAYMGRDADTGNPDSLYNRVRAGRAALAALTNKD